MARYRKIDIRMWGDREVRRLSRPQPNGQSLWVYLLAGPATAIIPGAYRAREGGLAEELGWTLEGFRKAFREVNGEAFREGSEQGAEKPLAKADWEAGMVWVPNGIKHNTPTSPNVITSWREAWDELPECDLKLEAYRGLRAFVEGMSKAFLNAFAEAIPEPSWKPCRKAWANQDQDQDQEQEGDARTRAIPGPAPVPTALRVAPTDSSDGASVGATRQKLTGPLSLSRPSAFELDPPDEPIPLKPCWRLWAIWEELAGRGPNTCGPRRGFRDRLIEAYASCESRTPSDPEGFWRRMVECFLDEQRRKGERGRVNLAFLLSDFAEYADRAERDAKTVARETLEDDLPEMYQEYPPPPQVPIRAAKEGE